jgi:hypothetical protein
MWLFVEPGIDLSDAGEDRAVPEYAGAVAYGLEVRVHVHHLRDKFSRTRRNVPVRARPSSMPQIP